MSETADAFEINLDGNHHTLSYRDTADQMLLHVPVAGWTETGLAALLAKQIRFDDLLPAEMSKCMTDVVRS